MLNRRSLLAATTAVGVGAGLSACRSGSDGPTGGSGGGGGGSASDVTPTYTEFTGVEADLPGDAELGIPNGFYTYPDAPQKVTEYPLPETEPISILSQGITANVSRNESNWWKMLQADLGNELPTTVILSTQYNEKFQTLVAGDQLPDLVQMVSTPELPKLLEAKFTDLGEFIGGDKVAQYPGLASIPTTAWQAAMVNGTLWGVPQARPPAGSIMSTRGDLLSEKGIDKNQSPADGAELLALMEELTDRKEGVFAMGADPVSWLMSIILEMVDAPKGWLEEGGKFTNAIETENYKEAIVHTKEFWDAGVLHPNSFSDPGSNSTWWQGGVTQVYIQGFTNWLYFTQRQPQFDLGLIEIPLWDGGGAAPKHQSASAYGAYAAITQQDSTERVEEILRVLDYLAAPYGSEEYLRANYGVEGEHYNMEDGVPISTDRIVDDPRVLTYFGSQALADLTGPRDLVDLESEYLHRIMPTSKADPSIGLYSDTASSKGAAFNRKQIDVISEIIQGRRELSEFDDLVSEYQNGIGKKIKAELEEGFQQQG